MDFSGRTKRAEQDLESGDSSKVEAPPISLFNSPEFCNIHKAFELNHGESAMNKHRRILFEESPSVSDLMMIRDEAPGHQEGVRVVFIHPDDYDEYEDVSGDSKA